MNLLVDKLLEGILDDSIYRVKQKQLEGELEITKNKLKELELKATQRCKVNERIKYIEQKILQKNILEKSTVNTMLDEIEKIVVYPTYLEIEFSCSKMLGIESYNVTDKKERVRMDYGNLFNYRQQQKDDLQMIVDYIKMKPNTTAREMAEKCGISTSGMQQRITRLRKAGKIRFIRKGGKGYWEVLDE